MSPTPRKAFEQVPALYDRARPSYPPLVFDDLVRLARLPPAAQVVEIGCGTGQATLPLAQRGFQIACVELGERLAAVTRHKLASFPNVEIVNEDFEHWEPKRAAFDAVVAFTAFHWIAPDLRYAKTARLLHEEGKLGIVSTRHVLPPDGDPFFVDVQENYEAVVPDDPSTKAGAGGPPHPDSVTDLGDEIAASGRFRNIGGRRYLWDVIYTADDYVAVLRTYSGHRALDEKTRERLLARIHQRVEAQSERTVRKTFWRCSTSHSACRS